MDLDKHIKYENYKEQLGRLNKALANGFNLEAIFIEYSIMEDRTESIIRHAGKWEQYLKKCGNRGPTLSSKIIYIKRLSESNRKDLLNRYFSNDLLDKIMCWKDDRNRMIHALLKQQFKKDEVAAFSAKGKELVTALRNKSGNYSRAVERKQQRELIKQ